MKRRVFATLLAVASACGQPSHDPHISAEEARRIVVVVDPAIASSSPAGALPRLRVGLELDAPAPGFDTRVSARREDDGWLLVDVNRTKRGGEVGIMTRIRLHGTANELAAEATTSNADRSAPCRGSIRMSHAHLADLTGAPLLVQAELRSYQSGSEITERHRLEIHEADLR